MRKSELNNFKDEPPRTVSVDEGKPYGIDCDSPDGWPPPSVYWMLQVCTGPATMNGSEQPFSKKGRVNEDVPSVYVLDVAGTER